jgi:integrase
MAEEVQKLNALQVKEARYIEKKSPSGALLGNMLTDGRGLALFITPNNAKSWRFFYRFGGKSRVLVIGSYPDLSLSAARIQLDKARLELAHGHDPAKAKQARKAADRKSADAKRTADKNTFRAVAAEWLEETLAKRKDDIKGPYSESWQENTNRWIGWANEEFGSRPLSQIEPSDIRRLLKNVARTAPRSAEFCRQVLATIWDHGILNEYAPRGFNPAAALRKLIKVPARQHRPKLDADQLPKFLADLDAYKGHQEQTKLGIKILLHTYARRAELIECKWSELDLDKGTWKLSADRMKMDRPFIRPLSRQVVGYFRQLQEINGSSEWVFPATSKRRRGKCISEQTFNFALGQMGYTGDMFGPHGARATAISILSNAGWTMNILKASLAHKIKDGTDAAYFRGDYAVTRTDLAQAWSDLLDGYAAGGAKVIPLNKAAAI